MADSDLDDLENILQKLPIVIPRGPMDVDDERYQFRSEKDIYFITKAPVSMVHEVSGTLNSEPGHTFVEGTDYDVIDDDGDGEDDSIDWSAGGDSPDDDTDFFVDYRAEPVISRYVGAHDSDVDGIESDINSVIAAAQVENATDGSDLEEVGAIFGEVGQRRGRSVSDYRTLLKSIVQSFQGRGTIPGLRFAISAGTGIDTEDITIIEDTDNTGYEIEIASTVDTDFIGQVVNEMAELADPSGVKLLSNPVILFDGDNVAVTKTETTIETTTVGLGGGILTLDGNSKLGSGTIALSFSSSATSSTLTSSPSTSTTSDISTTTATGSPVVVTPVTA